MIQLSRTSFFPYLALATGACSIAFAAIFVRAADAPGTITAFYRMAIGTVLVALPVHFHRHNQRAPLPRHGARIAVLAGVLFSLDLAFWTTGIDLSGATNPTLLANTAPLWVGLGSIVIFRQRQSRRFWVGLALALSGAAIILGNDLSSATELGLGSFYGLLAAVFYGAYYLVTERGRVRLGTLTYFGIATASAAISLLLINLILGRAFVGYSVDTYLIFLMLALVVQVGGWLAVNYAQGYLPASIVAPTLLLQPALTAILAHVLLGEILTLKHFWGGSAILVGVLVVHSSRRRIEKRRDR